MAEVKVGGRARTPSGAWAAGCLAWLVPGAGHIWQKRPLQGLLLGGAVWMMFAAGLALGGHLFDISDTRNGALSQVFGFFNLGTGALYIMSWMLGAGFTEYAERATYEYGNTFLMVAGLLNYLVMLDAFDIRSGRKP